MQCLVELMGCEPDRVFFGYWVQLCNWRLCGVGWNPAVDSVLVSGVSVMVTLLVCLMCSLLSVLLCMVRVSALVAGWSMVGLLVKESSVCLFCLMYSTYILLIRMIRVSVLWVGW